MLVAATSLINRGMTGMISPNPSMSTKTMNATENRIDAPPFFTEQPLHGRHLMSPKFLASRANFLAQPSWQLRTGPASKAGRGLSEFVNLRLLNKMIASEGQLATLMS